MTWSPSDADVASASAILTMLLKRGADPRLDADGRVRINGKATKRESKWLREHRDAFRAALVGAGRYVRGTLDRIYGLDLDDIGLTPPADPELRATYFTWREPMRRKFDKVAAKLNLAGLGRFESEQQAAKEVQHDG